jgi:hypothetical protein
MARIVPGVQVTVVKDVVPQQLAPSGVLGLVGIVEKMPAGASVVRASSWSRLVEECGPGTAYSMPEARQALDNGVFQLVVTPVSGGTKASVTLPGLSGPSFLLTARSAGSWATGLRVRVTSRRDSTGKTLNFDLEIQRPGSTEYETYRQLSAVPGSSQYIGDVLARGSTLAVASSRVRLVPADGKALRGFDVGGDVLVLLDDGQGSEGTHPVLTLKSVKGGPDLKVTAKQDDAGVTTVTLLQKTQAAGEFTQLAVFEGLRFPGSESQLAQALRSLRDQKEAGKRDFELVVDSAGWPADGQQYAFDGGKDATGAEYIDALQRLKDEGDVDLVLAAPQDFSNTDRLVGIYGAVINHCQLMANDCKGRIGFGQSPPGLSPKGQVDLGRNLMSDRFVLVTPHGTVGAVAGMVGSLPYFHSPTFKRVGGLGLLKTPGLDDQNTLVGGSVATVAMEPSKGLVVLRGLTTDGDQVSVRRVADHAVRGVKMIGDLFIGSLNTQDGRSALRQKLAEFLQQMEKENAIVPSTDGEDPAFKVDVYSSQNDFVLGIVRVDIAVRPVRAMDFIYATIQIQT